MDGAGLRLAGMRLAPVLPVLLVLSCSPAEPCGPDTCNGCCTVYGECMGGTEVAACGIGGDFCTNCLGNPCAAGKCVGSGPVDAGDTSKPDAGTPDAGPRMVGVSLRYEYETDLGGVCPNIQKGTEFCDRAATMTEVRFAEIQPLYSSLCTTLGLNDGGYAINCSGNCTQTQRECFDPPTGHHLYPAWDCARPAFTPDAGCGWAP